MGSATAVEYEIETGLECQDTGVCWRLPRNRRLMVAICIKSIHYLFSILFKESSRLSKVDISDLNKAPP